MSRAFLSLLCSVALLACASSHEELPLGSAGMSGTDEPETPAAAPQPVDPACAKLAQLAARDGTITLREDGSAVISVWLENTSDEGIYEYPGLNVRWTVEDRYAGESGDLFL